MRDLRGRFAAASGALGGGFAVLSFVLQAREVKMAPWLLDALGIAGALLILAGLFLFVTTSVSYFQNRKARHQAAERRALAHRMQATLNDLSGMLRVRSIEAPDEQVQSQREAARNDGRDPGREVHGDAEWQSGTWLRWLKQYRSTVMEQAEEAERLGACKRAERHLFNPTGPGVAELWKLVDMGSVVIQRLKGELPMPRLDQDGLT